MGSLAPSSFDSTCFETAVQLFSLMLPLIGRLERELVACFPAHGMRCVWPRQRIACSPAAYCMLGREYYADPAGAQSFMRPSDFSVEEGQPCTAAAQRTAQ
ncbi:hypothetical protein BQ8794_240222 [Mesorhizobium prunaredense]|uniref:Uncharacterized protein n=1 Tax=Mesorhizobium prunaredense TaxID=1631249 RepID=A0A1R3V7Z4_9HYPH|nr:hypothetical protein BQ8794_240222 [Mesorhizobium prunaredense]